MTIPNRRKGITLVELVLAIVIVSVAVAGMMTAYSEMMSRSADPLVYQQAVAIGEAMLEEVNAKPYLDPSSGTVCPAAPANRADFDNVCDYDGFSMSSITDLAGNNLSLAGYSVAIDVTAAGGDLSIGANDALRIDVTVTTPLNNLVLSSYRARY